MYSEEKQKKKKEREKEKRREMARKLLRPCEGR